jgi:hypothetical protein
MSGNAEAETVETSSSFSPNISPKFAVIIVDRVCNVMSSSSISSDDKFDIISHFVNLCKVGLFTDVHNLSSSLSTSLSSSPFNNTNNKTIQSFGCSFNNLVNIMKSFETSKNYGLSLASKGFRTELNGLNFLFILYYNHFKFLFIQFIQL